MNKTNLYRLTILVPVFNEEDNISRLRETFKNYLSNSLCKACVMFINDGSSDDSLKRIKEACQEENFFYISLQKNTGLSGALKAGISQTYSELTGYIDADLQTNPEDFNLLLPYAEDYELVTGIRANRKDSMFKNAQSKIANGFRRMMTHDDAKDTGCPLKIIKTSVAKSLPWFNGMHRFLPALVLLEGGHTKQIPVRHSPRIAGESKYHLWNRLVSPFVDCFAYRWMQKRYIRFRIEEDNIN